MITRMDEEECCAVVWDLTTMERVCVLDHPDLGNEAFVSGRFLVDGHLVFCSERSFCVWSEAENGEWSNGILYQTGGAEMPMAWGSSQREIITASVDGADGGLNPVNLRQRSFVDRMYHQILRALDYRRQPIFHHVVTIKSFDVRDGTERTHFTFDPRDEDFLGVNDVIDILVCNGKWLLLTVNDGNSEGIYVFDLETHQKMQFLKISITPYSLKQARAGDTTFIYTMKWE